MHVDWCAIVLYRAGVDKGDAAFFVYWLLSVTVFIDWCSSSGGAHELHCSFLPHPSYIYHRLSLSHGTRDLHNVCLHTPVRTIKPEGGREGGEGHPVRIIKPEGGRREGRDTPYAPSSLREGGREGRDTPVRTIK